MSGRGRPTKEKVAQRKATLERERANAQQYFSNTSSNTTPIVQPAVATSAQPIDLEADVHAPPTPLLSLPASPITPTAPLGESNIDNLLRAIEEEDDGFYSAAEDEEEEDDEDIIELINDGNSRDTLTHQHKYFVSLKTHVNNRQNDAGAKPAWLTDLQKTGYAWVRRPSLGSQLMPGYNQNTIKDLYLPDVFIWIPHITTQGNDGKHKNEHMKAKCFKTPGCTGDLVMAGGYVNPVARRIIDMNDSKYLLGWHLRCNKCLTECGTANPKYIRQLPVFLQNAFPFHMTHRSGITKDLARMTMHFFPAGFGPGKLAEMLRVNHMRQHSEISQSLMAYNQYHKQNGRLYPNLLISDYWDKTGYNGYLPSAGYLKNVFNEIMEDVLPVVEKYLSLLSLEVGKGDHSFKVIFS